MTSLSNAIESRSHSRRTLRVWLGALLLAASYVAVFARNYYEMWLRWFPAWRRESLDLYDRLVEGESYYTHGPLVPVLSLVIALLLIRKTRIPVRPNRIGGAAVFGGSLLLHLVASLARVNFASGFASIGVLAGLVLLLWGNAALRRLAFPLALLLFMVPLPEVTIAQLNFRLKMFASDWGTVLARPFVSVGVERTGNRVFLADGKSLVIANVCNGLRTLISLLAFGALYAYVCKLRGGWRWLLFGMSIPVAVVANTLRIVSLILVADYVDVETATGWYHDFSGLLIFVLAFLLMFGLEQAILTIRKAVGRPATIEPLFADSLRGPEDADQGRMIASSFATRRAAVIGLVLVLVAGCVWWLNRRVPSSLDPDLIARAVPERIQIGSTTYDSYSEDIDERTLTILEFPSYLNRRYVAVGQPEMDFTVLYSQDNRKGVHPPDLCLEGEGEGILAKARFDLDVPGLGSVPLNELVTVSGGQRKQYFLYTYKCGDSYTASFWRQQGTIFLNGLLNRNAGGALIRVSTTVETSVEDARNRSLDLLKTVLPDVSRSLRQEWNMSAQGAEERGA